MRPVCGICGGHITVTGFHPNAPVFFFQYRSTHIIHHNFRNILVKLLGEGLDDLGLNPDRGNIYIYIYICIYTYIYTYIYIYTIIYKA